MAVDAQGSRMVLVSGQLERGVRLYGVKTASLLRTLSDSSGLVVVSVAINGPGTRVLVGYWNNRATLFNANSGSAIAECEGHRAPVVALHIDDDSGQFLTGDRRGVVRLWDERGNCRAVFQGHAAPIRCLSLVGESVVTAARDGDVGIWTLSGTCQQFLERRARPIGLAVYDGLLVTVACDDQAIAFTNLPSGKDVLKIHSNMTDGFLFTDPDTGSFYTDDPGRCIDVVRSVGSCETASVVPLNAGEREDYLAAHEDTSLLDKINHPERYSTRVGLFGVSLEHSRTANETTTRRLAQENPHDPQRVGR